MTSEQTIGERADELGLVSYDTALPQPWIDNARAFGLQVLGSFVWSYDNAGVFGEPIALNLSGESMLGHILGEEVLPDGQ